MENEGLTVGLLLVNVNIVVVSNCKISCSVLLKTCLFFLFLSVLLSTDKQVDLSTVDLKKLKVKDLKKILDEWGESCKGCAEKSDFIRKITDLMPKYAPNAAKARTDL